MLQTEIEIGFKNKKGEVHSLILGAGMKRQTAVDFRQEVLDIYDEYVHGQTDRRRLINRAAKYRDRRVTVAAMLDNLKPNYALAQQVAKNDERIVAELSHILYPKGIRRQRDLVKPAKATGEAPAVLVIHENRGLNPYVEDVARCAAAAGFLALVPDALTPKLGILALTMKAG